MHLHIYFRTSSVSLFFIFYHRHVNIWLNSHSNRFVVWNSHSSNANFSWLRHIPISNNRMMCVTVMKSLAFTAHLLWWYCTCLVVCFCAQSSGSGWLLQRAWHGVSAAERHKFCHGKKRKQEQWEQSWVRHLYISSLLSMPPPPSTVLGALFSGCPCIRVCIKKVCEYCLGQFLRIYKHDAFMGKSDLIWFWDQRSRSYGNKLVRNILLGRYCGHRTWNDGGVQLWEKGGQRSRS